MKLIYSLVFVFMMFLSGCVSLHSGKEVKVEMPNLLMPDSTSSVEVDVNFCIPEKAFSKRSRLIVVPQLVSGENMISELRPLVFDAPVYIKKMERSRELSGYKDPYEGVAEAIDRNNTYNVQYREKVQVPEDIDEGKIIAVLSTDGCGECSLVDTVDMAYISNIPKLIDIRKSFKLDWIEPEFVVRPKVMKGRGEALLQFVINLYDINLEMGNNREEMNRMLNTLQNIVSDSLATLNRVSIYGMASADGPFEFNTTLSRNRANSAKNWLEKQLDIELDGDIDFNIGSRPEGWLPVLQAMRADGHPDTLKVQNILMKYNSENDDAAEWYIRRLSCWPEIRSKYLQKDRKVEYEYTYTIKSFTSDSMLLEMYEKRPDAFNEEELLRVSALKKDSQEKKKVYETILKYFPQSQIAANNLAVLWLREGNEEKAREIIECVKDYSPEMLNTLAASYVYREDYEKAVELLQKIENPQARYNLGLVRAAQRKLDEAYELLAPYGDVNAAIAALAVNRNSEAGKIMDGIGSDVSPLAEYVRALINARYDRVSECIAHLGNAVVEKWLRLRAAGEADFMKYGNNETFRSLVNGADEK